jgi:hypothetical protein
MQIGGPVCVEPRRPSTCPSTSLASYDILYNVITRARQVEEMKMRAFQGNHIFDFNDEPRNEAEDEEHFSISKLARRRDIRGNDIFGEGRRNNPWNLRAPGPCGKRHVGPCSRQSMVVDPQALRVNDPARYLTASVPDSCNGKPIPTFQIDMIIQCSLFVSTSEPNILELQEPVYFVSLSRKFCVLKEGIESYKAFGCLRMGRRE